ncbi:MAG: LamG domain-containing protein [Verrucomicrobia bacterium]|nr:LamG domain-containing protein [Verrucomicrobiota bacterium]
MRNVWLLWVTGLGLVAGVNPSAPHAAESATRAAGAQPANLDRDPYLVGHWSFEEVSGKTAADSSQHRRPATFVGSGSFEVHSASGRDGRAVQLEGTDEHLKVSGFKGVLGTAPRTLAAWIKTKSTSGEVLSWGSNEHGQMWTLGFIRGRIGVTPKGGYLYMQAAIHDDTWHHVAVVVAEASPPNLHDHVKLYLDGQPAQIHDIGLLDLWPIETGSDLDVRIGRRFKGLLDDVRIYERALSDDEIQHLFRL